MRNTFDRLECFLAGAFVVTMLILFFIAPLERALVERDSYQQGQIDALTGTVKYELVAQPDSSRVRERIDE